MPDGLNIEKKKAPDTGKGIKYFRTISSNAFTEIISPKRQNVMGDKS
jgi:hypothetical protein